MFLSNLKTTIGQSSPPTCMVKDQNFPVFCAPAPNWRHKMLQAVLFMNYFLIMRMLRFLRHSREMFKLRGNERKRGNGEK